MKIYQVAFVIFAFFSGELNASNKIYSKYYEEFKNLKKSEDYKTIFNEDAPLGLNGIQRDIENFKELTYLQRLIRFAFFSLDVLIVTPTNLPHLYTYVDGLCKKHGIATPTIFVTIGKGFFNAAAQKLFASSGAIVVGQKLLLEISEAELEAVVAHEIGHIKYNHVNKIILIGLASYIASFMAIECISPNKSIAAPEVIIHGVRKHFIAAFASGLLTSFIINKKYEKEADEFAYKANDNGQGMITFFEHLEAMEKSQDDDFDQTYSKLEKNQSKISGQDYFSLMARYYVSKGCHLFNKGYKWIYYNTFYGAHPSPQVRIDTVKNYLEKDSLPLAKNEGLPI